jgi:hypothetical protein
MADAEAAEEKQIREEHERLVEDFHASHPGERRITCKRFLQGACWKLEVAEEHLKAYHTFREELGEVRVEDFEEELKMGAFYFHGVAKETNTPLVVVKVGKDDASKTTVERCINLNVWVRDRVWEFNEEYERVTLLVDCSGMGLRTLSWEMLKAVAHMYNTYYPEVLHQEFIVNAPWIFQRLWAMMEGFLYPSTRKKIKIMSSKTYKKELLQFIAPENLQMLYGGTSEWEQPDCSKATAADPRVGQFSDRSL